MVTFVAEIWGQSSELSLRDKVTCHERCTLGGVANCSFIAWSEVDSTRHLRETNTSDSDRNTTRNLTEGWVNRSDSVRGTNNLGHIESVQIIEPSVVPATKDHKSSVALVVAHSGVLTSTRALFVLGHNVLPLVVSKVHEA